MSASVTLPEHAGGSPSPPEHRFVAALRVTYLPPRSGQRAGRGR